MRLWFLLLVCVASPAFGQTEIDRLEADRGLEISYQSSLAEQKRKQTPERQVEAIEKMRGEITELRNELRLIRELLQKLVEKQVVATPARKVWKQVRPAIQIEGMIDDGYELVEEPVRKKPNE